ncbi:PEGA domain-containing protein [Myxococcota bacterium]|nr:PEGA domain-containing protein [Myxococcota bacterium]MBU1432332.1 PEGA domain-containing protein [Myxococcota bacterium]MBU1897075.1 PEGA domain-containing protein [Myxococcota bacterium]
MRGLLFALALWPALVVAGEGAEAENSTADAAYSAGVEHFKARQFKDAILEFNKAYRANPHPILVFNMARCFEELKNYEAAVDFYQKYLKMNPEAADKAQVEESITTLKLLAGKAQEQRLDLQLTSQPDGARVFLNGQEVGVTPFKKALPQGTHFIALEAEGFSRISDEVEVADAPITKHLTLVPLPKQPITPVKPPNYLAWGLVVTGGAMLIGSGLVGYMALDKNNKLDEMDGGHATYNADTYETYKEDGRAFSYTADGLLLVGTTSLLTGGYLLLAAPSKD